MASLRPLLRSTPRATHLRHSLPRPSPITSITRAASTITPRPADPSTSAHEAEDASEDLSDPAMNGNYPDPSLTSALPLKRSLRDPYGPGDGTRWWDPIERRNYGEPVHEDNDILGIFSTEEYRHFTPARGGFLMGCFIASVGLLCAVVGRYYPDKPSAPRTFPGGLEAELGGPHAIRARIDPEEESVL